MESARDERRALAINTVAFAVAFAGWVVFGPCARALIIEKQYDPSWEPWLKATPILVGSLLRLPAGLLADRFGSRAVFMTLLVLGGFAICLVPLVTSAPLTVGLCAVAGVLGTSFVVGAQSVATVTPDERRGAALGIFGAGSLGAAGSTLLIPLANHELGCDAALQAAGLTMIASGGLYALLLPRSRCPASRRDFASLFAPLGRLRVWSFGYYYMASFGAFVALSLLLNDLFTDVFAFSARSAAAGATAFALIASLSRIPGGYLSDRMSPPYLLSLSFGASTAGLVPALLSLPAAVTCICVLLAGAAMGIGMSATLKAIPSEFPNEVGAVSGVVGALGGLAGFVIPFASHALGGAEPSDARGILLPTVVLVGSAWMLSVLSFRRRTTDDRSLEASKNARPIGGDRLAREGYE